MHVWWSMHHILLAVLYQLLQPVLVADCCLPQLLQRSLCLSLKQDVEAGHILDGSCQPRGEGVGEYV